MESAPDELPVVCADLLRISGLNVWRGDVNRPSADNGDCTIVQCLIDKVVPIDMFTVDRHKEITGFHRSAIDRQTRHYSVISFAGDAQALGQFRETKLNHGPPPALEAPRPRSSHPRSRAYFSQLAGSSHVPCRQPEQCRQIAHSKLRAE